MEMPTVIMVILKAIVSSVGSILASWAMKALTGPALEKLMLQGMGMLVERTESKVDNQLFETVKKAIEAKNG